MKPAKEPIFLPRLSGIPKQCRPSTSGLVPSGISVIAPVAVEIEGT